jgi:hypothetical protein
MRKWILLLSLLSLIPGCSSATVALEDGGSTGVVRNSKKVETPKKRVILKVTRGGNQKPGGAK